MMNKFGVFETEQERDAFVKERDESVRQRATALCMDPDSYLLLFGEVCNQIARAEFHIPDDAPDGIFDTSERARAGAHKIMEVLEGITKNPAKPR